MSSKVKPSISPLQARMIEDMTARGLQAKTQTAHIRSCRRFAKWLERSPDTATPEDVRLFQLHLAACGAGTSTRNMVMTGVKFCSARPCAGTTLSPRSFISVSHRRSRR